MLTFRTMHKHKAGTEIEVFGEYFTFDKEGWGTLTTDNMTVIKRLLEIPEGFEMVKADGKHAAPAEPVAPPDPVVTATTEPEAPAASPYVLKNSETGEEVDLRTMGDDDLKSFADDADLKVDKRLKGDKLRAAIVAAVTKPEQE